MTRSSAGAAFAGAVLAGGASRRMGRDKALVPAPDGRALVVVAGDALRAAGATATVAIGGDGPAISALGLDWVPDRHPGEGPLGGIVTALGWASEDLVVVMACDMPEVDAAVPVALVAALADAPGAGVAVAVVDGRDQPLTACWRGSVARSVVEAAFDAGERAPRYLLDALGVVRVEGLPARALADVDSPEDLHRYAEAPPQPPPTEQDTT